MIKNTAFLLILVFLVSCQNLDRPKKPKNLLTPVEMESLLTDMILLDAMISVNNFRIDNHNIDVQNFVYKKYSIDSASLSQNIEYYNEEYKVNSEIYSNVKTNIEELKQRLEYDKKLQDSIQKIKLEAARKSDSLSKKRQR